MNFREFYMMRILNVLVCLIVLGVSSGCKKDTISVYTIPPSYLLTWDIPKGWVREQGPASSFRLDSFRYAGKNGLSLELAVTKFEGDVGTWLANINRWRGQIHLPPLSESASAKAVKEFQGDGMSFKIVEFTSMENLIENRFKQGMVIATLERSNQKWFFKMTGEATLLNSQKETFYDFLKTVK